MARRIGTLDSGFPAAVAAATRRWNAALRVALIGAALGPALAGAGGLILLSRLGGASRGAAAAWLAAAALAALAFGLARARRRRVQPEQVAVLLDLRAGGSGRWLHAWEGGPAPDEAMPQTAPRPRGSRVLRSLLPALLFAATALAIPVQALRPDGPLAQDPLSAQKLAELQEMSRRLAESVPVEEEFRTEIERRLQQLEAGRDDGPEGEALREALDRVEDQLNQRAQTAADALEEAMREIGVAAEALAAAQEDVERAARTDQDPAGAQQRAEQAVKRADAALQEALVRLEKAGALGELPPDWAQSALEQRLATLGSECAASLERMGEQGLLGAGAADDRALAAHAAVVGDGSTDDGVLAGQQEGIGSGAPSRGPGTTPLTWGAETPELAAAMEAQAMPPPTDLDAALRLLQVVGTAPRADGVAEGVGTAGAGGATGQAAWQRRTAPHHREAVRRFFERKD